jgi:UPF0716 protein FxsA
MRFGWIVLLLLSFPVLEAIGIFWLASQIGWWVAVWLALAAIAGIALIRFERLAWGPRLLSTLQSGANPIASLFTSGRILLAGGLLFFPGFLSDIIALILLLLPGTWVKRRSSMPRAANDDVPSSQPSPMWGEGANVMPNTIDGEFRRETDDHGRLP